MQHDADQQGAARIIELRAENFKRLRAITIRPDGAAVVVGGRNAQGKSSTLDAIWAALGGKAACPDDPIRHGEKKAAIRLDLGELIVSRTFTKAGTQLTVTAKDGSKISSPQKALDAMIGALSFDPLDFARKPAKEQAAILREVAGVDTAEIDAKLAAALESRRELGRDAKRAEAHADSLPRVEDPGAVDVSELAERRAEIEQNNRAVQERQSTAEWLEGEIAKTRQRLAELLADLEQSKKESEGDELIDVSEIVDQIRTAGERNAAHAKAQERAKADAAAADARAKHSEAEKFVESLRDARAKALEAASFPVPGLDVDEDGVSFGGVPLEQCSAAERLRVSTAIGLALNPTIRVITIHDASLLDEDSLAEIVKMAEQANAQVWLERVGKGEEVGFIIEDGEIVGGAK